MEFFLDVFSGDASVQDAIRGCFPEYPTRMQTMPSSKERELTVPHFKEFRSERQYSNLDENHQKFKKVTVYSSAGFMQGTLPAPLHDQYKSEQ